MVAETILMLILRRQNRMWGLIAVFQLILYGLVNFPYALSQLKSFSDNHLYDFEWIEHGAEQKRTPLQTALYHGPLPMRFFAKNESYNCYVPTFAESVGKNEKVESTGMPSVTPDLVLQSLTDRKLCMVKVEGYWIYELCHGRHLRQFHQELVKSKTLAVTKEFILGLAQNSGIKNVIKSSQENGKDKKAAKLPLLVWDGKDIPYVQVAFGEGSPCDLRNNEPRTANIRYVCLEDVPDSIVQVSETATCEYQVIATVQALCLVSEFAPQRVLAHKIQCFANSVSYVTPLAVRKMQDEIFLSRREFVSSPKKLQRQTAIDSEDSGYDGDTEDEEESDSADDSQSLPQTPWEHAAPGPSPSRRETQYSPDEKEILNTLSDFVIGDFCVHGGTGYWKHSFCFGKTVVQYHEENDGGVKNEDVVTLGVWDETMHLEWIRLNPQKKPTPKASVKNFSNFYHDGDICDLTGLPRHVEVKLKCVDPSSYSASSVALYLLEPKPCSYILGVESRMFCYLVPYVNAEGIVDVEAFKRDVQRNFKEVMQ